MKKYKISLEGCDDTTVIYVSLTDEECKLIKRIANISREKSECGCQPTMKIEEED